MYNIEDIAAIVVEAGLGNLGDDLFLYHAPPTKSECTLIFPSNDPPLIDAERPHYFKGKFQTIVRSKSHDVGFAKCKALSSALTLNNVTKDHYNFKEVRPLHQPRVYRRSESGELEFSITYNIVFVEL